MEIVNNVNTFFMLKCVFYKWLNELFIKIMNLLTTSNLIYL